MVSTDDGSHHCDHSIAGAGRLRTVEVPMTLMMAFLIGLAVGFGVTLLIVAALALATEWE